MTWGVTTSLPWVDEFVRVSSFREHVRCLPARANASINLHHSSERYGLVSLLRRPALRMGFRNNRLSDGAWTHSHPKNIGEYIGLANLRLLGTYRSFDPHQAALNCFREIAEQRKRPVAPVDVVMIPGGGSGPFKRWSIAHYIRLADLLKTSIGRGTQFSFVLGPDEAAELELINSLRRPEFRIEYCRTIPELSALMLRARLIVANDCGPSHIAQGVGVPWACSTSPTPNGSGNVLAPLMSCPTSSARASTASRRKRCWRPAWRRSPPIR